MFRLIIISSLSFCFLYYGIDWKKKILLAVYVPEENKRIITDDLNKRNQATKDLYFGIANKGEECKFWFTDKLTIYEMVKDADLKYPKAVEIRIKPLSEPKISVRYIKDKKSNWVLSN